MERAVKEITGEMEYKFGELGKKSNDTETYEYKFGDVSKAVLKEIGFSSTTDNQDNTRQPRLQQLEDSVSDWRKDLPLDLIESFYSRFDRRQRLTLVLTGVQICAEGLVLWGLTTNICTIITANFAWALSLSTWSSFATVTSRSAWLPLVPVKINRDLWRIFVSKLIGLHLVLSPFLFIIRALGTLIGFRRYHFFVNLLSKSQWISEGTRKRAQSPILNKALGLIVAFFVTNIFLSAFLSGVSFIATSLVSSVWIMLKSKL
jgi:hypothetical protein